MCYPGLHKRHAIGLNSRDTPWNPPMRTSTFLTLVLTIGLISVDTTAQEASVNAGGDPLQCNQLTSLSLENSIIDAALEIEAGRFEEPPGYVPLFKPDYSVLPAFCRVVGSIHPTADSDIGFEVWLPRDDWNGRFLQAGNGGAAGSILYFTMTEPLSRGYAVAHTDTGHSGGGGEFSWALGHPEKLLDFQSRSLQEMTNVGKAITAARYGKSPERSYFQGCSTGGRQALTVAQRFPSAYDAIVAGAPANNWTALMALSLIIEQSLGPDGLPVEKLGLLQEAAIAACDGDDGFADRVISLPEQCGYDPGSLACGSKETDGCLSPVELEAARRIYAGVVTAEGTVHTPGTGPASEPGWAFYTAPGSSFGSSYFRYVVMADPNWDPSTFDLERDLARATPLDDDGLEAMGPNLSEFVAAGGKLLLYHGTTDGLLPYGNSVNYYESVVETLGADAIEDAVRFYLVPGMDHCIGGEGAYLIDWLSALERWEEEDLKPGTLSGVHPAVGFGQAAEPSGKSFTRPVCAYPQLAKFTGNGNADVAANWTCAAPQGEP